MLPSVTSNAHLYAEFAIDDRCLRLMGCEVYRFGGFEFSEEEPPAKPAGGRACSGSHNLRFWDVSIETFIE
jgi:hypothetical protein